MLSKTEINKIRALQEICESAEGIRLKLNWNTLLTRTEKRDFLCFNGEELVGFLAIYKFGNEVEICGMVHPQYRKQGIFSRLLSEALPAIRDDEAILINTPSKSQSAHAWLKRNNCLYTFSEYQMKWNGQELEPNEKVCLRNASVEDTDFIMGVDRVCFDIYEEERLDILKSFNNQKNTIYIIENGKEAIGKIAVRREDRESWVVGFAILPEYQGNGYGKSALMQTVLSEAKMGNSIYLEVALNNKNARKLYEQSGFSEFETQDYFIYLR